MEGICFLGQALRQRINMMESVLGKSVGREVDEYGFWCVMLILSWWAPCCHSSDDCEINEPDRFPSARSAPSLPPLLSRSPYGFCHDLHMVGLGLPMVEVGCGPAHSPMPHVAGHSPCPRNMAWLRGEHTGTFSPPFSHLIFLHFLFHLSLVFLSCTCIELYKALT